MIIVNRRFGLYHVDFAYYNLSKKLAFLNISTDKKRRQTPKAE